MRRVFTDQCQVGNYFVLFSDDSGATLGLARHAAFPDYSAAEAFAHTVVVGNLKRRVYIVNVEKEFHVVPNVFEVHQNAAQVFAKHGG